MYLKPQDIILALSLICQKSPVSYAEKGRLLKMSASEVHAGEGRLVTARLLDLEKKLVHKTAFMEFLVHGVPYVFATAPKEFTRGIPTAWAAPVLAKQLSFSEQNQPVWPDPESNIQGLAVEPLYRNVPEIAKKDAQMYELLALVDALRIGRKREKKLAEAALMIRIQSNG